MGPGARGLVLVPCHLLYLLVFDPEDVGAASPAAPGPGGWALAAAAGHHPPMACVAGQLLWVSWGVGLQAASVFTGAVSGPGLRGPDCDGIGCSGHDGKPSGNSLTQRLIALVKGVQAQFGMVGAAAYVIDVGLFNLLQHAPTGVLSGHPNSFQLMALPSTATVFSWIANRY